MSYSTANTTEAVQPTNHSIPDRHGSAQDPAADQAHRQHASSGIVTDTDNPGYQHDIVSQSDADEDSDYAEERWAAVEEELDNELPFAAGSSEDEEEDRFYFITTRSAALCHTADGAGVRGHAHFCHVAQC
jgi:hypothetical protein